jgi:hypothetical protein
MCEQCNNHTIAYQVKSSLFYKKSGQNCPQKLLKRERMPATCFLLLACSIIPGVYKIQKLYIGCNYVGSWNLKTIFASSGSAEAFSKNQTGIWQRSNWRGCRCRNCWEGSSARRSGSAAGEVWTGTPSATSLTDYSCSEQVCWRNTAL